MPDGAGLARLVDASAILSAEQQAHIAALHGEDRWAVDPAASSVVVTAPDGEELVCRAHFLGTSAPGPSTWLWGWRNINGFPNPFVALAERVRAAGEQQGVEELTTAELPLDDALPRRLAIAAKTITGLPIHYSGPIGGGSRAWLLIEHPDLELPAPSARRTADAIIAAADTMTIADHEQAIASWARQRRVDLAVEAPDEGHPTAYRRLTLPDGDVLVTLDEHGRISRVEARAAVGLDPAAAPHPDVSPPAETAAGNGAPAPAVEPGREPGQEQERAEPRPESTMRRLLGLLLGPKA